MQCQLTVDATDEGLFTGPVIINADDIVAITGIQGCGTGNAIDVDHIIDTIDDRDFITGIQHSDTNMS